MKVRNLYSLADLPNALKTLKSNIKKANSKFYNDNSFYFDKVDKLIQILSSYYKQGSNGELYALREENIKNIQTAYTEAINSMNLLKDAVASEKINVTSINEVLKVINKDMPIIEKLDAKDGLSLPVLSYKIKEEINAGHYQDGAKTKYPGFLEYSRMFIMDKDYSFDKCLDKYIKSNPETVKAEYEAKLKSEPRFTEYLYESELLNIPPRIRTTGNVNDIDDFINENDDKLSLKEKLFLERHKEATLKLQRLDERVKQRFDAGQELGNKPEVRVGGPEIVDLIITQPAKQSSTQGCSSCSLQMLVSSRGVEGVTQEDIRAYRPDIPKDEKIYDNSDLNSIYSYDNGKEIFNLGDSFLAYAPNTMLHQLVISPYSEVEQEDGIRRQTYVDNTVKELKKTIIHALKVDKSPVSLHLPGHYVTIVGIDKNTIKYKDSINTVTNDHNHVYEIPLDRFVARQFANEDGLKNSIELTWASDIKLAEDGMTIHGVPSEYAFMKPDGELQLPPQEIQENCGDLEMTGTNRNGVIISRSLGNEDTSLFNNLKILDNDGLKKEEKVYIPKKLDVDYLRRMQNKRSKEDEKALDDIDKNFYRIKGNKRAEYAKDPDNYEVKPDAALYKLGQRINFKRDRQNLKESKVENENRLNASMPSNVDNAFVSTGSTPNNENSVDNANNPSNPTGLSGNKSKKKNKSRQRKKNREKRKNNNLPSNPEQQTRLVLAQEEQRNRAVQNSAGSQGNSGSVTNAQTTVNTSRTPGSRNTNVINEKYEDLRKKTDSASMDYLATYSASLYDTRKTITEKTSFTAIKNMADDLLRKLEANKPKKPDKNKPDHFNKMIQSLKIVKNLAVKGLSSDRKNRFTWSNMGDLLNQMKKAEITADFYLESQYREMSNNPGLRFRKENTSIMQAQIKTAIDVFKQTSEMVPSLRLRLGLGGEDIDLKARMNQEKADKYDEMLVFENEKPDPYMESFSNRIKFEAKFRSNFDYMDNIFGLNKSRIISESETFNHVGRAIGSIGSKEKNNLSNKDFAALSFAGLVVNAEGGKRYDYINILDSNSKLDDTVINDIKNSRSNADRLLKAYHDGNKKPLAKLITNAIKKIVVNDYNMNFSAPRTTLCCSEMGQRLYKMLERDPELQKLARKNGLKDIYFRQLKAMEQEGKYRVHCKRWVEEINKGDAKKWGDEKEERYVDMLMDASFKECRSDDIKRKTFLNRAKKLDTDAERREKMREYLRITGYIALEPEEFLKNVYLANKVTSLRKHDVSDEIIKYSKESYINKKKILEEYVNELGSRKDNKKELQNNNISNNRTSNANVNANFSGPENTNTVNVQSTANPINPQNTADNPNTQSTANTTNAPSTTTNRTTRPGRSKSMVTKKGQSYMIK